MAAFMTLTVVTFGLVVLGATVRANHARLACPDWPLCFGSLVPRFDFGVALEWGHRVLAGSVSLGLLTVTVWLARRPSLRAAVVRPLAVAWALLAVQIVLGGLTVLLGLAPWTVVAHLLAGTAFCASLLWCACALGGSEARDVDYPPGLRALALLGGAGVVVQIALGGLVSSHFAGLACHAFPTCDGVSLVPTLRGQVGLHVVHRLGACALLMLFALLVWATRGTASNLARYARSGLRLVLLQFAVGVANVWLLLPVELTALHTGIAAALLLVAALMLREIGVRRDEPAPAVPSAPAQALGTS
jgi:cytochrome c oxidase assembly protein subunit 15